MKHKISPNTRETILDAATLEFAKKGRSETSYWSTACSGNCDAWSTQNECGYMVHRSFPTLSMD